MAQDRGDMRIRGRGGSRPSFSRSFSRVSQRIRKGNGRKVLVVIVLFFVSIMATTIIVSLSVRLRTSSESSRYHSKVVRLGDVLPDSFVVEFKMFHYSNENISNNTKENITTNIEWERKVKCGFRYKEKRRQSSHEEEVLTVTDNQAILQLTNDNKTTWSCFNHVENLGFYSMLRLIVNATRTDQYKPGLKCPGTLWSVYECHREIFICEAHGIITSIHDDMLIAHAASFSLNTSHGNFLPKHNISCHFASTETVTSVESGLNQYMDMSVHWRRSWKSCVFVHGIGVDSDSSSEDIGRLYWSNVRAFTPQCSDHRFIKLDTLNNGWDSVKLHKKLCRDVSGHSKVIKDTVIFAHSMGNLVMAAALFKNICSFDAKSSEWYAIQAPWKGTKFADKLNELCKMNRSTRGYIASEYLVQVLKEVRYCTEDGNPVPAFQSLSPKHISSLNVSFQDLIQVGKMYVTGAVCGYSPWGMGKNWLQSSAMMFAQAFADLDSRNDGVVSEESCEIVGNFTNSYTSKFYRTKVNHIEGTFRYEETDWCKAWWKKHEGIP
ncbi:hypothetical protein CHS0354_010404 [Potamilus streckersoni]|uniref:Uncharacterized protein n=1 Tax=Potamilus streckersoni TaxID=2493646 RepID=A0AAE0T679_9BIVA|nr:hypothetical protein CHS0354_010404 [Potamilus streckersoni]